MALVDVFGTVALVIVIPPFLLVLITVLMLASFGKSLGIREKYVEYLLKLFEVGFFYLFLNDLSYQTEKFLLI